MVCDPAVVASAVARESNFGTPHGLSQKLAKRLFKKAKSIEWHDLWTV